MELLETTIPTVSLLFVAPVILCLFAIWKLKMNVVNCMVSFSFIASVGGIGFASGEMSSYKEQDVELDREFLEGITINGSPVSADDSVKITQYVQCDPILTYSQACGLLAISIASAIMSLVWAFQEDEAIKRKSGRHATSER